MNFHNYRYDSWRSGVHWPLGDVTRGRWSPGFAWDGRRLTGPRRMRPESTLLIVKALRDLGTIEQLLPLVKRQFRPEPILRKGSGLKLATGAGLDLVAVADRPL